MRGAGIKRGGAVVTAIKLDPLCKVVEIKFNISLPLVNTFLFAAFGNLGCELQNKTGRAGSGPINLRRAFRFKLAWSGLLSG